MNSAIIGLSCAAQLLPIVSLGSSYAQSKLRAVRFYQSKSSQPSIIANGNHRSVDVDRSSFSYFLNSPIKVSETNINGSTFSAVQSYSDSSVSILNCAFLSCIGSGAIQVSSGCSTFSLYSCSFTNCTSSSNGGAISSSASLFACSSCCFYLCSITSSGYGSAIQSVASTSMASNMTLCAAVGCPTSQSVTTVGVIRLYSGAYKATNNNFSLCSNSYASGIYFDTIGSGSSTYFASYNQSTASIIGGAAFSSRAVFDLGNVVNTSCSSAYLYSNGAYFTVENFVFIRSSGSFSYSITSSYTIYAINCTFDYQPTWGGAVGGTSGCVFNGNNSNLLSFSVLNSGNCHKNHVLSNMFTNDVSFLNIFSIYVSFWALLTLPSV